jgi:hypothetical protein
MPINVALNGFDLAALMSAALAQAIGQQKAKYAQDVATQIGANAFFELIVGTAKYRTTISGSLTGSSAGITVPSVLVEPPSINTADALTASNAVVRIRNASNSAIYLDIPVKVGGASDFLTASAALDGTKLVRTSALILESPAVLDISGGGGGGGGGGGSIYLVDTIIKDMTLPNDNRWHLERAQYTAGTNGQYAQITVGINRADGNSGYPNAYLSDGSLPSPNGSVGLNDSTSINLNAWYVAGRAKQSTTRSGNSRLHTRGHKLYLFLRNNTWVLAASSDDAITDASWHATFASPGLEINDPITTGSALYQIRDEGVGESLGSIGFSSNGVRYDNGTSYDRYADYALHGYPINTTRTRGDWVANVRGILQVMEARLIVHNPSAPDDRGSANIMIWSGGDWRAGGQYLNDGDGVGRLKLVKNDWDIFTMCTVPSSLLLQYPPPGFV